MSSFFKISEAGSIALHAMVMLARNPGHLVRIKEIADSFSFSEAHLAKVLGRLVKAGLIEATRGPLGGYKLSVPSQDISIVDIFEAIEGKLQNNKCMFKISVCDGSICSLGGYFSKIAGEVEDTLSKTKLSDISFNKDVFNLEVV
ncbi:RrF2 family transcriptional regulator [Candidatus Latescibacterota bacterium]